MRSHLAFALFVGCVWLTANAQEPKTQPKPAEKLPVAVRADKDEPVPGRKLKKIEGFNFLISDEALNADTSKFERSPLAVLEFECKMLSKALSPKAVDLLRRLTIWVDWDDKPQTSSGRSGFALASYFAGSPQQAQKAGRHPLQSKTVTIHNLQTLTKSHQPKNDAGAISLLLHEFAHAIHDQIFGFDHAGIKAAYEQAMERKLYDKECYAATNHKEFFAELTCAYLDRLEYYPHNRADLKKYDPVTYKTMETVWTGAAGRDTPKSPLPHAEKTSLDAPLSTGVKFGPTILGPELKTSELKGKIVLIGFWGGDFTSVLTRLDRLNTELGDYGLVAVGAGAYVLKDEVVKAKVEERDVRITVVRNAFVKDEKEKEGMKAQPGGHALLFDQTGKCVYRGSAYDADEPVRAAVGKLLFTTALGTDEVPKAFKPVADAFAAGNTPVAVLPKLTPLAGSSDPDTKDKAKKLHDLILAPGEKALTKAEASVKTNPLEAFITAEKVATKFKGTPLATKANAMLSKLRTDKAVAAELKARAVGADIEKLAAKLRAQEGSFKPTSTEFQTENRQLLTQMRTLLEQMRKNFPNAPAITAAEKVAREFGVQ